MPFLNREKGVAECCPATILYIDDEPMLLDVAKAFLELEKDIIVDVATSAKEGLEKLTERSYEVIVSDFQMPVMDGLALLRSIRQRWGDVPFVLFTGRGREEVAMEALNSGANFYLQKGGDPRSQFGELRHVVLQLAQRRRAEMALHDRDKKLRMITDNMRDVVVQLGAEGVVQYLSPSVYNILGYRPEDLMGRTATRLIHPDDMPSVYDGLMGTALGNSTIKAEVRFLHAQGHYVWLETSGNGLYDAEGKCTGSVIISRDVTSRKETQERLEESERKYRELVEGSNSIVLRMDLSGRIRYINEFARNFFGYTAEELIGKNVVGTIVPLRDETSLGMNCGGQRYYGTY